MLGTDMAGCPEGITYRDILDKHIQLFQKCGLSDSSIDALCRKTAETVFFAR